MDFFAWEHTITSTEIVIRRLHERPKWWQLVKRLDEHVSLRVHIYMLKDAWRDLPIRMDEDGA